MSLFKFYYDVNDYALSIFLKKLMGTKRQQLNNAGCVNISYILTSRDLVMKVLKETC